MYSNVVMHYNTGNYVYYNNNVLYYADSKYRTVLQSLYIRRRGYIMWSVYLGLMERSTCLALLAALLAREDARELACEAVRELAREGGREEARELAFELARLPVRELPLRGDIPECV